MPYIDELLKLRKSKRTVRMYAITAATVSAFTAVDPEPLSGTALMVFADTPVVTGITLTMIVHLAIIYEQKNLIKDGLMCAVAVSAGTVLGALGAKILGRVIPVLGPFNNAIITFSLHYATGMAVVDFFSGGKTIKDLKLSEIKKTSEKYKEEGKRKGKEIISAYKKMSKEDKSLLKGLTKEYSKLAKEAKTAAENNKLSDYDEISNRMVIISEQIADIYARYGIDDED